MAFDYNGSTSANSIPDITGLSTFSVVFSLYADVVAGNDFVFAADNYPTSPREGCMFNVKLSGSNRPGFEVYVDDTGDKANQVGVLTDSVWHTAVCRRTGATVECYIDGASIGSITVGTGTVDLSNIRFGCHYFSSSNQQFFNGRVAQFGLYNIDIGTAGVASYEATKNPMFYRPDALLRYIPAIRDKTELITGATISDIGSPGVAAHVPALFPTSPATGLAAPAASNTGPRNLLTLGCG